MTNQQDREAAIIFPWPNDMPLAGNFEQSINALLEAKEREMVELRADKERLDWILDNCEINGTNKVWELEDNTREAIDQARGKQ